MTYTELRRKQQEEFNAFPLGFAFGDEQFEKMMNNWGLDARKDEDLKKIVRIYSGAYCRREDLSAFHEMCESHDGEMQAAIEADKTGENFIYDMFYYELCNHEYGYTLDCEDTLDALGYTPRDISNNEALRTGLMKAARQIREEAEQWDK